MTQNFVPTPSANFFQHIKNLSDYDIVKGSDMESELDQIDDMLNNLIHAIGLITVADIQTLRDLDDTASYTTSATEHPAIDIALRRVKSISDGSETFRGIYMFVDGDSTADADDPVSAKNVDTDGIVEPSASKATGRWFRIAGINTDGTGLYLHTRGIVGNRTMYERIKIDLDTDTVTSDVGLEFVKRTAGTQVKILTNEQIAIRNAADSADEDLALLNITASGTDHDFTGTPPASATDTVLGLGVDIAGGSANGNYFGINSASGYTGDFIHIQLDDANRLSLNNAGNLIAAGSGSFANGLTVTGAASSIDGGDLNMNSNKITNVTDPTAAQDAATMNYVDTQVGLNYKWGGDNAGGDGAATISAPTTLTADKYYTSLTVDASQTLTTDGFIIFSNDNTTGLALNGTIAAGTGAAGTAASATQSGEGGVAKSSSLGGVSGRHGTTGGLAASNGINGEDAPTVTGGADGADGGNAASARGCFGGVGRLHGPKDYVDCLSLARAGVWAAGGAAGGRASSGDDRAGGGGGASAPTIAIFARKIVYGASSAYTGVGGAGGQGGAGGTNSGGGGGGGAGALVLVTAETITSSVNSTTLTGGAAGAAGGGGSSDPGGAGAAGPAGFVLEVDI